MANSVPATNSNARQPNIMQGVPGVHLVPAPQGAQPAPPGVNPNYRASAGLWTGGIQLACGVASFVLGIASLAVHTWLAPIGTGIWTGLAFYIATGILGIVSGKKSRCVIISYMVMSILSSVAAGSALVIFGIEASDLPYYYYGNNRGAATAIIVLLIIISLVELVTSITAAAFCCAGTSCCSPPPVTTTPVIYYFPAPQGTYTMPPGMVAFSSTSQQAAPHAPSGNSYTQQPFPMVQYPAGQPPMQWQPQMAAQPPVGHQAQHDPTGGGAMTHTPAGEGKPPPYS